MSSFESCRRANIKFSEVSLNEYGKFINNNLILKYMKNESIE